MSSRPLSTLIRDLRRAAGPPGDGTLSDAQLLGRWADRRDEAAFELLLWRHGPMILGVCRRLLHDAHDAEDAFQAAWLVLVRKASSLRKRQAVAAWLHRVAYRVALRARAAAGRRAVRERPAVDVAAPEEADEVVRRDLRAVLDEEIDRLPARQRRALVLCCLEGMPQAEAARQLGCPQGTLSSWLTRARARLRGRLARRGLALGTGSLAFVLPEGGATAGVPAALVMSTANAVKAVAVGGVAAGAVSARVAALAEGAARGMAVAKLKVVAAVVLLASVVAAGAGMAAHEALTAKQPQARRAERPQPPADGADRAKADRPAQPRTDRFGDPLPEGALARLGTLRFRQGGNVHGLAVSPDGKTLASCGVPGVIRLWDLATGKERRHIEVLRSQVMVLSVAFSPDGKAVASGSFDVGGARLWDAATGKLLRQFKGNPARANLVRSIAFSPDGKILATGGVDKAVRLWDVATGKELRALEGHRNVVSSVAFAPGGRSVVSGSEDQTVRLWEVATGKELRQFVGHHGEVLSVALSHDGKMLASAARDRTVRLWEAATGKELHRMKANVDCPGYPRGGPAVAFSPDGKSVAAAGRPVTLWETTTGKELHQFRASDDFTGCVVFSKDGKRLISGSVGSNSIHLWDVATGKECSPFGAAAEIWAVAFSPNGKTLATVESDQTVRLWEAATGREFRRLPRVSTGLIVFSPDGKSLATSGRDEATVLWDVATGRKLRALPEGGDRVVGCLAFSGDGKALFSGSRDGTILLRDARTGRSLRRFPRSQGCINALAVSCDGKMLGSCSLNAQGGIGVQLWDVATGQELRSLHNARAEVSAVVFSPDGKSLMAATEEGRIVLWDVATGQVLRQLKAADPQGSDRIAVALSPDGKALAWGGSDGAVHVWEVATGGERCRFRGHRGSVWSVAFGPDGRALVSLSGDLTALVWDLSGRDRGGPRAAALSPEGLARLWADLADADAARAYRAMRTLVAVPRQAVPFLGQSLRPVPVLDAQGRRRMDRWIAELDSRRFGVREKAAQELEKLGEMAAPALRQKLADQPSPEVRRRVKGLLERLAQGSLPCDQLRLLRAVEVLEEISTSEARQLLETLARGAREARLTQEARASVERLTRRPSAR